MQLSERRNTRNQRLRVPEVFVRRSASKLLRQSLSLSSEGGPNFGCYPKSLGMSQDF